MQCWVPIEREREFHSSVIMMAYIHIPYKKHTHTHTNLCVFFFLSHLLRLSFFHEIPKLKILLHIQISLLFLFWCGGSVGCYYFFLRRVEKRRNNADWYFIWVYIYICVVYFDGRGLVGKVEMDEANEFLLMDTKKIIHKKLAVGYFAFAFPFLPIFFFIFFSPLRYLTLARCALARLYDDYKCYFDEIWRCHV